MSRVGLVLGGGGVTGAAFHFGALLSLQMATGWDPARSDVVVGTSSGAVVAAFVRSGSLDLEALVGDAHGEQEFAEALGGRLFVRTQTRRGVGRWLRHGLIPGLARPGISMALGSPAPYTTDGIVDWLTSRLGDAAGAWPDEPTIIVAYCLEDKERVAFGTEGSPDVGLATAAAASSAVPMIFQPVSIYDKRYVDGGVATGTSADLVLGGDPLDLLVVVAPMASVEVRPGARRYEGVVDRLGGTALTAELDTVKAAWPDTDLVVLRPDVGVLEESRPNPLSPHAALPTFLRTLRSMRSRLAQPEIWSVLQRHLGPGTQRRRPLGRRRTADNR